MNYETIVTDLFDRFPRLELLSNKEFAYMGEEKPGAYLVFGSVLIPALEKAVEAGDLASILRICAFLEDAAKAAEEDLGLRSLLQVEVGEWLGVVANEASLAPWLGEKTRRICGYVPGLATQRAALRKEQNRRSLALRISSFMRNLRNKLHVSAKPPYK
jgi:hypothetical protein